MMHSILYGPIMGKWHRTPSLEMAAHMVMLAPLCPGTVIVALSPYFTEIEAGFISLNEDIMCTPPRQLLAPLFCK